MHARLFLAVLLSERGHFFLLLASFTNDYWRSWGRVARFYGCMAFGAHFHIRETDAIRFQRTSETAQCLHLGCPFGSCFMCPRLSTSELLLAAA